MPQSHTKVSKISIAFNNERKEVYVRGQQLAARRHGLCFHVAEVGVWSQAQELLLVIRLEPIRIGNEPLGGQLAEPQGPQRRTQLKLG